MPISLSWAPNIVIWVENIGDSSIAPIWKIRPQRKNQRLWISPKGPIWEPIHKAHGADNLIDVLTNKWIDDSPYCSELPTPKTHATLDNFLPPHFVPPKINIDVQLGCPMLFLSTFHVSLNILLSQVTNTWFYFIFLMWLPYRLINKDIILHGLIFSKLNLHG